MNKNMALGREADVLIFGDSLTAVKESHVM